ncbi:hypothetical protein [Amnibacterium endophyticum]|uniref:Tetratrico peptide repeat group 5 domain-containing protein n=1 Tax=Amnibacterium endophyticum TaxID=2109337 RepID=A0ABW4LF69_9MICO
MAGSDRPFRDGGPRRGVGADREPGPGRHVDEPVLPEDVRPGDLDRAARAELRTLSKENADAVARHLVMAGRLIEDDPAEAHRHALAAARRAGRVAVVRESVAITAYANGDFALALRELRTFRRISGSDDQIGLMVDSERGVGRPDRALEVGRGVDRATLPVEAQVALAIAMSGARLDLEDPQGALDELERVEVDLQRVHPWSPVLFEALSAVHEDLGDADAAALWARRAERAGALLSEVDEEASSVVVDTEAEAEAEAEVEPSSAQGGTDDDGSVATTAPEGPQGPDGVGG